MTTGCITQLPHRRKRTRSARERRNARPRWEIACFSTVERRRSSRLSERDEYRGRIQSPGRLVGEERSLPSTEPVVEMAASPGKRPPPMSGIERSPLATPSSGQQLRDVSIIAGVLAGIARPSRRLGTPWSASTSSPVSSSRTAASPVASGDNGRLQLAVLLERVADLLDLSDPVRTGERSTLETVGAVQGSRSTISSSLCRFADATTIVRSRSLTGDSAAEWQRPPPALRRAGRCCRRPRESSSNCSLPKGAPSRSSLDFDEATRSRS